MTAMENMLHYIAWLLEWNNKIVEVELKLILFEFKIFEKKILFSHVLFILLRIYNSFI